MLNLADLQQFTSKHQTSLDNILREYCQHLFLSYLYQEPGSEKLYFKGGTALRILFQSPRYSEDLDFTAIGISVHEIEKIFEGALANVEKTGIAVKISEAKETTGGYLGIAEFLLYGNTIHMQIEISFREGRQKVPGARSMVMNDYITAYTIAHLPIEKMIEEKIRALLFRRKPRDFYDFFFLLSGNFPQARDHASLEAVLKVLREIKINFKGELRRFLPASHAVLLKNFPELLEQKIKSFL